MKLHLLVFIISGASVCTFAQPTMDFETWTTMNNGTLATPEEPTGWITGNQLVTFVSPGNSISVTKVTGTEAHGGLYAMKIVTVDVVNDPSGGQLPDPTGVAFVGKVQISPLKLINGFPYTAKPATCEFWYKYTPQTGDSASCGLALTKWNGIKTDTIATGNIFIKNTAAFYVQATFNLIYNPLFSAVQPDTMRIGFSATCIASKTCGVVGSTLWVDDITFTGTTGMNQLSSFNDVELYPNPCNQSLNISAGTGEAVSVVVLDVIGKIVASAPLTLSANGMKETGAINTSGFAMGLYSYSILDKSGNPMRAGKFNVVR
ncbi:MAG: PCMD domain-containing protein [Bacteroidetes bacterium]|nr:PCMD domain-containing protein [Bacteroidota bacterium]